jgi:hypothetical protein
MDLLYSYPPENVVIDCRGSDEGAFRTRFTPEFQCDSPFEPKYNTWHMGFGSKNVFKCTSIIQNDYTACMNSGERDENIGYAREECTSDSDCSNGFLCVRPPSEGRCVGDCNTCGCTSFVEEHSTWINGQCGGNPYSSQFGLPYIDLYKRPNFCKSTQLSVGTCQCDAQRAPCPFGLPCVAGRCRCSSNAQCRAYHNSSEALCMFEDPDLAPGGEASPLGYCSCNPSAQRSANGGDGGCHFNGQCAPQSVTRSDGTLKSVAQRLYAQFDDGTVRRTQPGECSCFGGRFSDVFGESCHRELERDVNLCSGRGRPICNSLEGDTIARSLQTNRIIGAYCRRSTFGNRGTESGSSGRCQCDEGWGPDQSVKNGAGAVVIPPCSKRYDCARFGILADTGSSDGENCRCDATSDTYSVQVPGSSNYACAPSCRAAKCSGHGSCIHTQVGQFVVAGYANDCECDLGWTSSIAHDTTNFPNPLFVPAIRLCDQPYDLLAGPVAGVCGKPGGAGFWDAPARACACTDGGLVHWPLGRADSPLRVQRFVVDAAASGLCVERCLALDSTTWNAAAEGRAWPGVAPRVCGGPARGTCAADPAASAGSVCRCKNGYSGLACETPICPRAPGGGLMCSGNGLCDVTTQKCICADGFLGDACETRDLGCSAGQALRSRPTLGSELLLPRDYEA